MLKKNEILLKLKDDIKLIKTIKKRLETSKDDYLDGDEVLKELNLSLDK